MRAGCGPPWANTRRMSTAVFAKLQSVRHPDSTRRTRVDSGALAGLLQALLPQTASASPQFSSTPPCVRGGLHSPRPTFGSTLARPRPQADAQRCGLLRCLRAAQEALPHLFRGLLFSVRGAVLAEDQPASTAETGATSWTVDPGHCEPAPAQRGLAVSLAAPSPCGARVRR